MGNGKGMCFSTYSAPKKAFAKTAMLGFLIWDKNASPRVQLYIKVRLAREIIKGSPRAKKNAEANQKKKV